MGLVKIDLLGIRGLTVLNDVAQAVLEKYENKRSISNKENVSIFGDQVSSSLSVLDSIPEADESTAQTLRNGRTIGCFQIESPGMRATLKEIQASSKDDIMVALALYRPGPLTGGLKEAFVRRHLGQEEVRHLDPALGRLLEDTYGVILYQEQVLEVASALAGLSFGQSDSLRRAMTHDRSAEEMHKVRDAFLEGCRRRGVADAIAVEAFRRLSAFAAYGFCKAHAASFAIIAYQTAYLKAHYPAEFLAGILSNQRQRQDEYYPPRQRVQNVYLPPHEQG